MAMVRDRPPRRRAAPRSDLVEWRCPNCGALFMKLKLGPGSMIEVKCRTCNTVAVRER